MYKNQEGYADPTAGQALANIRREEKARLGYMPLVYICSPFRGDVENNMRNARKYCAFALSRHALPIATHLLFPQFMGTKETPQTREMALYVPFLPESDDCRRMRRSRRRCDERKIHRPRRLRMPKPRLKRLPRLWLLWKMKR